MMDVAAYQAMVFPEPRCWSLVALVYLHEVGREPTDVRTVTESIRVAARAFRLRLHKDAGGLQQVSAPQDFAIMLMWPTSKQRHPHCGIFYAGSVLHATPDGVLYQDMASMRDAYPLMEFWA